MTIFLNYLKRLLKNRVQLLIMLILPILPIIPIVTDTSVAVESVTLGIVDDDKTELTYALINNLMTKCKVVSIEKGNIENNMINYRIQYAIVLNDGFTSVMIESGECHIEGYSKKESDMTQFIKTYIDSFINPVKQISASSGGNSTTFYQGLHFYQDGILSIADEPVKKSDQTKADAAWSMIFQFMMFSSVFASNILIADKENRTFFRTLSAPVSVKNYIIQVILCLLTISVLQVMVLTTVTIWGFGIYPGTSALDMLALLIVFSLVCVSLGLAVSVFCTNTILNVVAGIGIVVLMSVAGGAWGDVHSSATAGNALKLIPVTWAIDGMNKLINNGALASIVKNLGVLILFSIAFFLVGIWKKTEIAK